MSFSTVRCIVIQPLYSQASNAWCAAGVVWCVVWSGLLNLWAAGLQCPKQACHTRLGAFVTFHQAGSTCSLRNTLGRILP